MDMMKRNLNSIRVSRINPKVIVTCFLFVSFFASLSAQTFSSNINAVTNIVTGTNINYTVKNDVIEFPLVLKFKGFRLGTLSTNDLKIDKIVYRNVYITNKFISSSNLPVNTNTAKKKKSKKKAPDEQSYLTGASLFNKKLYAEAEEKFKEALSTAADGKFGDDANIYIARIKFIGNDQTAAFVALDAVKQKRSQASYYRALFYTALTNDEKAIVTYETMKQQDEPDAWFFETAYAVRMSFIRKKMGNELITDLEKFLGDRSVATAKDKLLFTLAELYEKDRPSRDLKKAMAYYERLVLIYPNSPDAKRAAERAEYINKNFLKIR